jgi:hypothetical protein
MIRFVEGIHRAAARARRPIVISAPVGRIMKAFFEAQVLNAWLQVTHAVTAPGVLGPYALA